MSNQEKIEKLKSFKNEKEFREFLVDLLKKNGFKDVLHTHRYGSPELGKDIIARRDHDIEGSEWYAFVVKLGRIGGGSVEVETIKSQIKQSFEYPYSNLTGHKQTINKVKVITNENFTSGAQNSIENSPDLKIYRNFDFWWNETLIDLIDKSYNDFWLPGDQFSKEYIKNVSAKISEEFELKELSIRRIEDVKIKRLIEIFVEPRLIESFVSTTPNEDNRKKIERKLISISTIINSSDCFILTGDPGSGKTKILNNLTSLLLDPQKINEEKILPVKLKGKELRDKNFNISETITENLIAFVPDFKDQIDVYKKILLIDEIDILTKEEKLVLAKNLEEYCTDESRFIITQRNSDDLNFGNVRNVKITNFNIKQIESFIVKYFQGTDKGEKFIQVLKDSNIFEYFAPNPAT